MHLHSDLYQKIISKILLIRCCFYPAEFAISFLLFKICLFIEICFTEAIWKCRDEHRAEVHGGVVHQQRQRSELRLHPVQDQGVPVATGKHFDHQRSPQRLAPDHRQRGHAQRAHPETHRPDRSWLLGCKVKEAFHK